MYVLVGLVVTFPIYKIAVRISVGAIMIAMLISVSAITVIVELCTFPISVPCVLRLNYNVYHTAGYTILKKFAGFTIGIAYGS